MSDLKDEILEFCKKYEELYNKGDFDALADVYTNDAYVMPPGSEILQGKEGIKTLVRTLQNLGGHTIEKITDEAGEAGGSVVYFRG